MKKVASIFICMICLSLHAEMFFTPEMISSHLKTYSEKEVELIEKDLNVVRSVCFEEARSSKNRFFLATAGAPGARKTTILETFVSTHPEYQEGVYLDPDPRTLRFMVHTYYGQSLTPLKVALEENYDEVIKKAYNKWRGGSNYIVLKLMEEAFAKGYSVVHGTTSTGGHIPAFLTKLKKAGYQIVMLLCSCPDQVRYDAVDYRNKEIRFYQSSPEDALEKGLLFPQRIESYFTYADQLYFYWSDAFDSPERLAGIWKEGKLEIHDSSAMQAFIDKYEQDRAKLKEIGCTSPFFNALLAPSK